VIQLTNSNVPYLGGLHLRRTLISSC